MIINLKESEKNLEVPSLDILVNFPSQFIQYINEDKKFLNDCAELIKEALAKPSDKDKKDSDLNLIYSLCRYKDGMRIFAKVLKVNPKIANLISQEDLSFIEPKSKTSTLFLLFRSEVGMNLFIDLRKLNKKIPQMITKEALCTLTKLDSEFSYKDKNTSALFWMIRCCPNKFINCLLDKNPEIAKMITSEALCTLGPENTSTLYWFFESYWRCDILLRLLKLNPKIAHMINKKALCALRDSNSSGKAKNTSALYWMCSRRVIYRGRYSNIYCDRRRTFMKLLELNPKIARMITPESLYAIRLSDKNTKLEYMNKKEKVLECSPLYLLFYFFPADDGYVDRSIKLIIYLLDYNPEIANWIILSKEYVMRVLLNRKLFREKFSSCYSLNTLDLNGIECHNLNLWTIKEIVKMNKTITEIKHLQDINNLSRNEFFFDKLWYGSIKRNLQLIYNYIERNKSFPQFMRKVRQYFAGDNQLSISKTESRWFRDIFHKKLSSMKSYEQFIKSIFNDFCKLPEKVQQALCFETAAYLNALGDKSVFNQPTKDISFKEIYKEIALYLKSIHFFLYLEKEELTNKHLYRLLFKNELYENGSPRNKELVKMLINEVIKGTKSKNSWKNCVYILTFYKLQDLSSKSTKCKQYIYPSVKLQNLNTDWIDIYDKYKEENRGILKEFEFCKKILNKNLKNNRKEV